MNASANEKIDHINHNTLDNRRENLRACTNAQNAANQKLSRSNRSGFKGVCWCNRAKKWIAYLSKDKKFINLGLFTDPVLAAKAYDAAAIEKFGEFACTNKYLGLV